MDIIACFIVFSEVVVSACVVLSVLLLVTLVLTMCWCMDLYVCMYMWRKNVYRILSFLQAILNVIRYTTKTRCSVISYKQLNTVVSKQFEIVLSQIIQTRWFYDELFQIEVGVTSKDATRMTVVKHFSGDLSECRSLQSIFFSRGEWQTFRRRSLFHRGDISL